MFNSTQSLKQGLAINVQTVNANGVFAGSSINLSEAIFGELVVHFAIFSGATAIGDFTVQDVQLSKVSNFSTDVITIDSSLMEHFIPADIDSTSNALAQTKINGINQFKKIGVHLIKNHREYGYIRLRLFGANSANMIIGATYNFLTVSKPVNQ